MESPLIKTLQIVDNCDIFVFYIEQVRKKRLQPPLGLEEAKYSVGFIQCLPGAAVSDILI